MCEVVYVLDALWAQFLHLARMILERVGQLYIIYLVSVRMEGGSFGAVHTSVMRYGGISLLGIIAKTQCSKQGLP